MVMLHKSKSVGGVEKMLPVDSIPVPSHQSVTFAPGGFHLMCMSPAKSMKPGTSVPVTLTFEGGVSLTSDFSRSRRRRELGCGLDQLQEPLPEAGWVALIDELTDVGRRSLDVGIGRHHG